MIVPIPKDLILILSGVSCVGKTTTAYNLLKKYPEFKRVSETDILRTMLRTIIKDIESSVDYTDKEKIRQEYASIFDSLTYGDINTLKRQSTMLSKYVKEIVKRQQARKIPTIIEGISIVPSTYFHNNTPIDGFDTNVIFINLFVSDESEHIRRRLNRCIEREYDNTFDSIKDQVANIRRDKNDVLHEETLELSAKVHNVFSIDISNMDQEMVVDQIINIISHAVIKKS